MSTATQPEFAKDSWQTPRNARTLRAYMALQNQEIAGRIRELRGRRPQTVVAEALGVAERTYQNWEAGDAKPNYRSLQRLAEYYGVGEDFILAGSGDPTPRPPQTPDLFAGGSTEDRLARIEEAVQGTYQLLQNASDARHAQQEEILQRIEALQQAVTQTIVENGQAAADDEWVERVVTAAREALQGAPQKKGSARSTRAKSGSRPG